MHFKTRALTIKVNPNGIIELINNKDWNEAETVEVALENIEMLKKAVDGKPRGMLSYMPSTYIGKDVLECYNNADIGEVASALLTTSFASKIIGNLYLKMTGKSSISNGKKSPPVKIFSNEEDAVAWLLERIEEAKRQG